MAETARTISAGNLGRRLALAGPDDEFKQLADTLDDLLARLESSFETQRRFVANASHELRTPLTLERTLLQVALADPDASAATLRTTCEELLASGRDQEALLESLLTLATSERGLERREPLDLAVLADRVVTDRSRLDGR
jgi:signal transduction histidine kinase